MNTNHTNWWAIRALMTLLFVVIGVLFVHYLTEFVGGSDVVDLACLTFLPIMACMGLILALLMEIQVKIAVKEKKRRN